MSMMLKTARTLEQGRFTKLTQAAFASGSHMRSSLATSLGAFTRCGFFSATSSEHLWLTMISAMDHSDAADSDDHPPP